MKSARKIINFQIIWTIGIVLLLIISPFLQDFVPQNVKLILCVGLVAIIINLVVITNTAIALMKEDMAFLSFKFRLI